MEVGEAGPSKNQKFCPSCNNCATYLTRKVCKKCWTSFEEIKLDGRGEGSGSNDKIILLCLNAARKRYPCPCRNCRINNFIETTGYSYTNPAGSCRKCCGRTILEVHECSICHWLSPSIRIDSTPHSSEDSSSRMQVEGRNEERGKECTLSPTSDEEFLLHPIVPEEEQDRQVPVAPVDTDSATTYDFLELHLSDSDNPAMECVNRIEDIHSNSERTHQQIPPFPIERASSSSTAPIMPSSSSEEQSKSIPQNPEQQSIEIPPSTSFKNMEVIDITVDSEEEETEEVIGIEKYLEEMSRHKEKIIQAVDYLSEHFQVPPLLSRSSPTPPPDLSTEDRFDHHLLFHGFDPHREVIQSNDEENSTEPPSLTEPQAPELLPQEEEMNCRSALHSLSQKIISAQTSIFNAEKSLKEEANLMRLARAKSANDLRRKIDELQTKDRSQSAHLSFLMELGKNFQHQLNDLNAQKIQLERELREYSKKRIKLEPSGLDSSAGSGERNRQRNQLLSDVKEKSTAILKEETLLSARILVIETEKKETAQNLTQMKVDLCSLEREPAARSPSAIAVQLEALKREQVVRIRSFVSLEKKLLQISFGYVLGDVCRMEEEWINGPKH